MERLHAHVFLLNFLFIFAKYAHVSRITSLTFYESRNMQQELNVDEEIDGIFELPDLNPI